MPGGELWRYETKKAVTTHWWTMATIIEGNNHVSPNIYGIEDFQIFALKNSVKWTSLIVAMDFSISFAGKVDES